MLSCSTRYPLRLTAFLTLCFFVAYIGSSALDLWTTHLALVLAHAREGNTFATANGAYDASRAWLFTCVAGVPLTALFAFGVSHAHSISREWLNRPWRSFLSWHSNPFVTIPWSRRVIDRSPLHAMSFSVAFVELRLLAAVNNAMIVKFGAGPLGLAIFAAGRVSSATAAFAIVIGSLYVLLVLSAAKAVARFLAGRTYTSGISVAAA